MGFGPRIPSMTPIAADIQDVVPRVDFWSAQMSKITLRSTPADLTFPSVTVSNLSDDITIIAVYPIIKVRLIKDTSGADNYIGQPDKSIRIKKFDGAWGTDDIVAIQFTSNQWYTVASTKEAGDVILGHDDLKSVVDSNTTYNFRSDESNRGDAISAFGDSLELYDVQMGLRVYYRP